MLEIVLLTGHSGAGKTTAQYVFEESGYFGMDNVLPFALDATLDYLLGASNKHKKVLFITQPQFALEMINIIKAKDHSIDLKVIVLDCDYKILLKRFKLSRHVHPSSVLNKTSLTDAINEDKKHLETLKPIANYVIDTTTMEALDLRKILFGILSNGKEGHVSLVFMSFGQKYGNPLDADLILDTRALPNPYWDAKLKHLTGLDKEIDEYLESFDEVKETFKDMTTYLDKYLDLVQKDGRGNYTIGICCSGGKHRSVYFAKKLGDYYAKKYNTYVFHRDIKKDE